MSWWPLLVFLLIGAGIAFWKKQKWFGWYIVYVGIGLGIFEFVSKLESGKTISQNFWQLVVTEQFWAWIFAYNLVAFIVYLIGHLFWRKENK